MELEELLRAQKNPFRHSRISKLGKNFSKHRTNSQTRKIAPQTQRSLKPFPNSEKTSPYTEKLKKSPDTKEGSPEKCLRNWKNFRRLRKTCLYTGKCLSKLGTNLFQAKALQTLLAQKLLFRHRKISLNLKNIFKLRKDLYKYIKISVSTETFR